MHASLSFPESPGNGIASPSNDSAGLEPTQDANAYVVRSCVPPENEAANERPSLDPSDYVPRGACLSANGRVGLEIRHVG